MQLIHGRPPKPPHHCALIPHRYDDPDGFFDAGSELPGFDNHVYVSAHAVKDCARELGWLSPDDAERLLEEVALARARVTECEQLLEQAAEFRRSAEYTLQRFGQKVQKKPGRKPKKPEVANA